MRLTYPDSANTTQKKILCLLRLEGQYIELFNLMADWRETEKITPANFNKLLAWMRQKYPQEKKLTRAEFSKFESEEALGFKVVYELQAMRDVLETEIKNDTTIEADIEVNISA